MNKILKFMLGTLTIVLLTLGITSCKSHTHKYSNYWLFDEEAHWHESTCKHDLVVDRAEHNWNIEFLNEDSCKPGASVKYTCQICGYTKQTSAESHNYAVKDVVQATCTQKGYTVYECIWCKASCVADFTNATGHNFGEAVTKVKETCSASGLYEQTCTLCSEINQYTTGALEHSYILLSREGTSTTYECEICYKEITVTDDKPIEEFIGTEELFDVPISFAFDIVTNMDEAYIKENIKIIDAYFENTEYESNNALIEYVISSKGSGIWTIAPVSDFEFDTTYIAKLAGEILFTNYNGNKLTFTTEAGENRENVVEYQNEIVFLKALENANPGYYPYSLTSDEEYMYLITGKIDNLFVGQILCIGEVLTADDVMSGKECYFGKIDTFHSLPNDEFMVVLTAPELHEIFEKLDISFEEDINFDEDDIDIEQVENEVVSALYDSEDFVKFLSVVKLSATNYLSDQNYDVTSVADTKSFLDYLSLKPSIRINGTTLSTTIVGSINIPIKNSDYKEIGSFKVNFTVKMESCFKLDVSYKIKKVWFVPVGLDYFDICMTQTDNVGFNFTVSIDIDYSLDEHNYVQNLDPKSLKIHRRGCPYLNNIKDLSNWRGLSAKDAEKILSQNPEYGCKRCQPVTGFSSELIVLNTKQKVIHAYGCTSINQINNDNKQISNENATYWMNQGYSCCDWCHPDAREELDYESYFTSTLYCSDWQQIATDISQRAKDAGVAAHSQKGITLVRKDIPIYGPIMLTLEVDFVFSIKLEASITYEYAYEQVNIYGMRVQSGSPRTYTTKTSRVLANELTIMGKIEVRAGLLVDINVNIAGLSKWLRAGITAEVGLYARLSGIVHVSFITDEDYAAAYFEMGIYLDVNAYYKLFAWDGSVTIYSNEWPLIHLGYEKAYFGYEVYQDKIEITNKYNIADKDLLKVKYFDLKSMSVKIDELSLAETEKYKVSISFENGVYCEIKDGCIVYNENAPCFFTDTMIITVESKSDWKDFKKGSAVYYIKEYVVDIEFSTGAAHVYSLIESSKANCEEDGVEISVCSICQKENKVTTPALGHTKQFIDGEAATCTESGLTDGEKCTVCRKILVEQTVIPAKGHSPQTIAPVKETCTTSGLTRGEICTVCQITLINQDYIAPLDHDYKDVVTSPDCTSKGYTTCTCSRCLDSYTKDEIQPLGHTFVNNSCYTCGAVRVEGLVYQTIPCEFGIPLNYGDFGYYYQYSDFKEYLANNNNENLLKYDEEYFKRNRIVIASVILSSSDSLIMVESAMSSKIYDVSISEFVPEDISESPEVTLCHVFVEIPNEIASQFIVKVITKNGVFEIADSSCQHVNTDSQTLEASCTADGKITTTCLNCLKTVKIEILPMLGHLYKNKVCSHCGRAQLSAGLDFTSNGDGTCYVSGIGTCNDTEIMIPAVSPIGDIVVGIGANAFEYCSDITDVIFENVDQIGYIGSYAFAGCTGLTGFDIPDTITSIGDGAFFNCYNIRDLTISDNVSFIGDSAFALCVNLANISVSDQNSYYKSIDGNLYSKDGKVLIKYASGNDATSFTIPNDVTTIARFAFSASINLETVDISDNVTTIENCAFAWCSNLKNIKIPTGVTAIGNSTFYYCKNLSYIELPSGITNVGENSFNGCTSLTVVYYVGNENDWANVSINRNNDPLINAIHYYSELEPEVEGNFWHYVDGVPTPWPESGNSGGGNVDDGGWDGPPESSNPDPDESGWI